MLWVTDHFDQQVNYEYYLQKNAHTPNPNSFHEVSAGLGIQAKKGVLHRVLRDTNYIERVIKNWKHFVIEKYLCAFI